jgi:hypothetical protein
VDWYEEWRLIFDVGKRHAGDVIEEATGQTPADVISTTEETVATVADPPAAARELRRRWRRQWMEFRR